MELHARCAPARCAYCHDHSGALEPCRGCGTAAHSDCWAQTEACLTLGCTSPEPYRAPRPAEPWLFTFWVVGSALGVAVAGTSAAVGLATCETMDVQLAAGSILAMLVSYVGWALS